jgi:hypothetical protein
MNNVDSWKSVVEDVASFPDNTTWSDWKQVATDFLLKSVATGLDRYFRAGQSMHWFLFSTLDHHGLRGEPCVVLFIHSRDAIEVYYGTSHFHVSGKPELSYTLPFDEAFGTFHRFLLQLWTATKSEPIPADIRGPDAPFEAPVLTTISKH